LRQRFDRRADDGADREVTVEILVQGGLEGSEYRATRYGTCREVAVAVDVQPMY
jgi:hypothetical protein